MSRFLAVACLLALPAAARAQSSGGGADLDYNALTKAPADEVEEAWIWAEDILRGWDERPDNVHPYSAGSWGPAWADAFIERDGRRWRTFD